MRSWSSEIWRGEWSDYLRFIGALFLIVCGVFTYFSITGCGSCGSGSSPTYTSGSEVTNQGGASPSPYNVGVSNTSSKALNGSSLAEAEIVLPGAEITRYISYTVQGGLDPTQIAWTPPEGASNFNFHGSPPTNPSGPAPYIFDNNPVLTFPLHITYNAPQLPDYATSLVVGEVYVATRAEFSDNVRLVNYTISSTASRSQMPPAAAPSQNTAGASAPTAFSPLSVERYVWVDGITMTTDLCQQAYDWLQSDDTFIAMRMPVSSGGGADISYESPVLFTLDTDLSADGIDGRPNISLNVSGIPDLPLELRSDRISFMENYLPSVAGEHWVALGVAQTPKITCPAGVNQKFWEFSYEFPVNPATSIDALPLYHCQEGDDSPPIGGQALKLLARQPDGKTTPSTQVEGITCIGPQQHNLDPDAAIHVGNPSTVWSAYPQDEVRLEHYIQTSGDGLSVKFSIDSGITGAGWKLYEGDDDAPNLSKEIDISKTYAMSSNFMFVWVIGAVPAGTEAGSYNVTLRAEKSDDANTYGSATDTVWVGQWVTPVPPGGQPDDDDKKIFLPMIRNK